MIMSHAVVVGVDGSAQSAAAAEWAAYQAHRSGRALRLIHVGARPEFSVEAADPVELLPRPVLALRDQIVEVLPGLTVSCEHVPGSPAEALVAAGDGGGLLVLGSRGIGGLAGLLLGSVALRAAAHAACPVVLVGAGTDGQGDVHGDVVVGVDSSHWWRPRAALRWWWWAGGSRRAGWLFPGWAPWPTRWCTTHTPRSRWCRTTDRQCHAGRGRTGTWSCHGRWRARPRAFLGVAACGEGPSARRHTPSAASPCGTPRPTATTTTGPTRSPSDWSRTSWRRCAGTPPTGAPSTPSPS
ncbi:hypothetical protein F7Q99_29490 [Streptomyces kaniharaensis]|uniref:UspA domain-containing protein n=1 Tax=Streptomyces kaniharaensis TaxID=212423 RepID=A0A6N7L356_9ACTN|nr:hypothetical protein [Streptomyces kaniharaensis]